MILTVLLTTRERHSMATFDQGSSKEQGDLEPLDFEVKSDFSFLTIVSVIAMARGSSMQSLQLEGMVGMMDPPRPGAADAISTIKASGVDVKLITGDSQETAVSIGKWPLPLNT